MNNLTSYKTISCQNCKSSFVWSQEEQELYAKRDLPEPKYCPICRGMMSAKERDNARLKYEGGSK